MCESECLCNLNRDYNIFVYNCFDTHHQMAFNYWENNEINVKNEKSLANITVKDTK